MKWYFAEWFPLHDLLIHQKWFPAELAQRFTSDIKTSSTHAPRRSTLILLYVKADYFSAFSSQRFPSLFVFNNVNPRLICSMSFIFDHLMELAVFFSISGQLELHSPVLLSTMCFNTFFFFFFGILKVINLERHKV